MSLSAIRLPGLRFSLAAVSALAMKSFALSSAHAKFLASCSALSSACANVLLDKLEHGTLHGCTGVNMMQDREQIQIYNNGSTYHYEIGNFYNETGLETQVLQRRRTPKLL